MNRQQFDNQGGIVQFQGTATDSTFNMYVGDGQSKDRCLDYLAMIDPRDVKTDIQQRRGGVLKESYCWILDHPEFQRWRDDEASQLLWIKGNPGKGKTMLLCGIIDQLLPVTKLADTQTETLLSFFFCQADDRRLNNAHAVLRGLIYMVVKTQQPSFLSHVRGRFKDTGEPRFGDAEAWAALCNIFLSILRDSSLEKIYIIIDALDECVQDQDKLLKFVLQEAKLPRVKWIISSRNNIEQRTRLESSQSILSLEHKENADFVLQAIEAYIANRTSQIESLQDDCALQEYVRQVLRNKAEGTFLWVALVVLELEKVDSWKVRQVVDDVPNGLDDLYARMIDQIKRLASIDAEYCRLVLSAATLAYRPLQLLELGVVSGLPDAISSNARNIEKLVKKSGSFLTVRNKTIYFVHQTAKDYLERTAASTIFPSGSAAAHRRIFRQSLLVMKKTLRRDMYDLRAFDTPIDQAKQPEQDHLAAAGYSCVYWVDHLEESGKVDTFRRMLYFHWLQIFSLLQGLLGGISLFRNLDALAQEGVVTSGLYEDLQNGGPVDTFLRERCLYWLEALSLLRSMTEGIMSVQKLERLLRGQERASGLSDMVRDARRFILYHRGAIENIPLQTYRSALVFSPSRSIIKELFPLEMPERITTKPMMGDDWDAHTGACLQSLDGHNGPVQSVVFSHDSSRIASGSGDNTIKIWDWHTAACLQTLDGHSGWVESVAFSHDSSRVASGSRDSTIKIWNAYTGACLQTLDSHSSGVSSVVFSHNSSRVASGSRDKTIKIWNAYTAACLQTLDGHKDMVLSVVFSYDSSRIASGSRDKTIKIWDAYTAAYLQTLDGHNGPVQSVVFSHDSSRIASGSGDKTIKIWDAYTAACLQTLDGHSSGVESVAFSHNSSRVASGSRDKTIKIWNWHTAACLQTLDGHNGWVNSVVFSHDSSRLASGSRDNTIKIWDVHASTCLRTLHIGSTVYNLSFNPTGSYLHTNIGTVALLDSPTLSNTTLTETLPLGPQVRQDAQEPQKPQYRGYGVSPDGVWITRNSQNMLWLPREYRSTNSDVAQSGLALALACASGRVLIFAFSAEDCD